MVKIIFSWDDGAPQDIKLIKLHEKYDIPGMFFVPSFNKEGRSVITDRDIIMAKSEIVSFGCHTNNHTYLTTINKEYIYQEVIDNKHKLEDLVGVEISDFCLPGGKYNTSTLKVLFNIFKTVRTADTMNFRRYKRIQKPSFHFYPRTKKSLIANSIRNRSFCELPLIVKYMNNDYFDMLKLFIEREVYEKKDTYISIWGHSWEIDELELWGRLEELFKYVRDNKLAAKYCNGFL